MGFNGLKRLINKPYIVDDVLQIVQTVIEEG
jgi:hypothetical protein